MRASSAIRSCRGKANPAQFLKLKDNCPGFDNPRKPQGVVYTGHAPAQRFSNEIHNLTIDTGAGNPGACGAQFIANNQGGMWDVDLVSADGQGASRPGHGLYGRTGAVPYQARQGCRLRHRYPCRHQRRQRNAGTHYRRTSEQIRVRNDGQPCTIRDLHSVNEVPACTRAADLPPCWTAALRARAMLHQMCRR